MFLSLLTADAAAQHGHEFSTRPSSPAHTQSPAPLSPLGLLSAAARSQHRPSASPLQSAVKSQSADGSRSPVKPQKSIMFAVPPETTIPSRPTSLHSVTTTSTTDGPSRKRSSRPKTSYNLAHPPPRIGPLHLRPRVLLQLHQSSASSRPKPAYEAVPSTTFAPRLKRKFRCVFRNRDKLGPDDVVIVKAGEYGMEEPEESDDEALESREVVGVVCANLREERTEICMDDDSVWVATLMSNGGYEFIATDEHGLQRKARWVPKPVLNRRTSSNFSQSVQQPTSAPAEDRKFNFSTISPDSRRHPVIASMTRASIEVWDKYTIPSPTVNSPMASPAASDAGDPSYASDDAKTPLARATDEQLRKLIIVTGIWVAFREKWSPVFNYRGGYRDSVRDSITSSPCASPALPFSPVRTVSMASITGGGSNSRSSSPGIPDTPVHHPHRSVSRLLHRTHALAALTGDPEPNSPTPPSTAEKKTTRSRRANSTGTAFMQRAHSKRNPKRHSSGTDIQSHTPEIHTNDTALVVLPSIEDRKLSGEYASTDGEEDEHEPVTGRHGVQSMVYPRKDDAVKDTRVRMSAPDGLGLRFEDGRETMRGRDAGARTTTAASAATPQTAPVAAGRVVVNGGVTNGVADGKGEKGEKGGKKEKKDKKQKKEKGQEKKDKEKEKEKKGGVIGLLRRFRSKKEKR